MRICYQTLTHAVPFEALLGMSLRGGTHRVCYRELETQGFSTRNGGLDAQSCSVKCGKWLALQARDKELVFVIVIDKQASFCKRTESLLPEVNGREIWKSVQPNEADEVAQN
jgi:hypothetical protein